MAKVAEEESAGIDQKPYSRREKNLPNNGNNREQHISPMSGHRVLDRYLAAKNVIGHLVSCGKLPKSTDINDLAKDYACNNSMELEFIDQFVV